MNALITYLVQTAIQIAKTQLDHPQAKVALLDIIQTGVEAYEEHTGQPLDLSLIRFEQPLN